MILDRNLVGSLYFMDNRELVTVKANKRHYVLSMDAPRIMSELKKIWTVKESFRATLRPHNRWHYLLGGRRTGGSFPAVFRKGPSWTSPMSEGKIFVGQAEYRGWAAREEGGRDFLLRRPW